MCKIRRTIVLFAGMLLSLILLGACSSAVPEAEIEYEATRVLEEEGIGEVTDVLPTRTPAPQPTPIPTQPVPTPTVIIEVRTVDLEWPPRIRLGDSDVVRLALVPSEEGYQVETEFPDHQTDTQDIQVARPGGYELVAIARLDGVGFDIAPAGEQARALPLSEAATWHWSITPRQPGQQRLTVVLLLHWEPGPGTVGIARQAVAYSRGLDVRVSSFFGLTRGQAMTGGFLGLLFGGGLFVFALVSLVSTSSPAGVTLRTLAPNQALVIEAHPGLGVSQQERSLLQALFRRYARLVLEREFLSGYSGARAFLALPVHSDGRADAYTIVKIGGREAIAREYENYQRYVKATLPPITARIQAPPATLRGYDQASLQYTFIAEPGRMPVSLRQALLENPDPSLLYKLFDSFGPNWWMQRRPYSFRLAAEYDRMLPPHYVLQPADGRGPPLDGRSPPGEVEFSVGDIVLPREFQRVEKRLDGESFSLKGHPSAGNPPLRTRWLSARPPHGAAGRVVATRWTLLADFTNGFELYDLPEPLARLPKILDEGVSGTKSVIHGDLNLENALVGPGDFVWLIDFATTRDGHTPYDFAHLEAELIAHVIAPQTGSPEKYLAALRGEPSQKLAPYYALRSALGEIAGRCLFNPNQPREYHLALYMACLGALKFANLNTNQKHLLYLTAAQLSASL
jgi:hypothetical protein